MNETGKDIKNKNIKTKKINNFLSILYVLIRFFPLSLLGIVVELN